MKANVPYATIPRLQRWHECAPDVAERFFEIQGPAKFEFPTTAKVASAGSCFSARLAERLQRNGLRYLFTETAPAAISIEQRELYGYLPFSARYGFIYNTLQLVQLLERALGLRTPVETAWERDGRYVDPFRPRIVPDAYPSIAAVESDREQHLQAVRRLFSTLDVFVFTAGLTEVWTDSRDGSAYPICPGVAGGEFDSAIHRLRNVSVAENLENLKTFAALLKSINPKARIIVSVSPVPISATIEHQHVVRSSAYSKAALRAAMEEFCRDEADADYFASYDMIAHHWVGIGCYQNDGRHILPEVVDHITRAFVRSYFPEVDTERQTAQLAPVVPDAMPCDEDLLLK